jgi:hypothetical protein
MECAMKRVPVILLAGAFAASLALWSRLPIVRESNWSRYDG